MHFFLVEAASESQDPNWRPRADVYRAPYGWVLKFDLAGVRPEDIAVQARDSYLKVSGVRRDWTVREGWSHQSMEISYSRFERTLELPCDLERCRIRVEYREGMLLVHIEAEESRS